MIRAGVIGHPVEHSLSPVLHGYWLEKYGINGRYDAISVDPDRFEETVRDLVNQGMAGFNVTIPFKQRILDMMDDVSPRAQVIGAVNTVVVMEDGGLLGDNTDAYGYEKCLKTQAPLWQTHVFNIAVIGAGGATRAIVYNFLNNGRNLVHIYNRTPEKAEKIAEDFAYMDDRCAVHASRLSGLQADLHKYDLIINTTSLGMHGQPALDLDLADCKDTAIISDIVYTPRKTPLLMAAEKRGLQTVEGLPMLVYQAAPGFEYWFNKHPEVDQDVMDMMYKAAGA